MNLRPAAALCGAAALAAVLLGGCATDNIAGSLAQVGTSDADKAWPGQSSLRELRDESVVAQPPGCTQLFREEKPASNNSPWGDAESPPGIDVVFACPTRPNALADRYGIPDSSIKTIAKVGRTQRSRDSTFTAELERVTSSQPPASWTVRVNGELMPPPRAISAPPANTRSFVYVALSGRP